MTELICLHCHVLAGLDDGPGQLDESIELISGLHRLGFAQIHPTPHQRWGAYMPTADEIEQAHRALTETAPPALRSLVRRPAAEYYWDAHFLDRVGDGTLRRYEDSRSFLVELSPTMAPPQWTEHLFRTQLKGLLPVLAHVERYDFLSGNQELLRRVAQGSAITVNLTTLGGLGGWRVRRAARRLVRRGVVHALTTDLHTPDQLAYCSAGLAWLEAHHGTAGVRRLLHEGPKCILAGEIPEW
jgi:protein-tyrosine phosphatase